MQIEEVQNIVKDGSVESLNWNEERVELLEQTKIEHKDRILNNRDRKAYPLCKIIKRSNIW